MDRTELRDCLRELPTKRRRAVRQGGEPETRAEAELQLAFHRHRLTPAGFAFAVVPGMVGAFIGITLWAALVGQEGERFPSVVNIVAFVVTYGVVTAVLTRHYGQRGIRHAEAWLAREQGPTDGTEPSRTTGSPDEPSPG